MLRGIQRMLRDPETHRGPSVCGCGYHQHGREWVHLSRDSDGRASADGIARCRSLYLCPVCTLRRAQEIQERARRFADGSLRAGCWVYMVTLTVRHAAPDQLADLRDRLADAFRKAQQGAPYTKMQRAGLLGIFRTVEVRWSEGTGWHPHLHLLVSVDQAQEKDARALVQRLVNRYLDRLDQAGAPADRQGQDVTLCHDAEGAGEYAAKGALELTSGIHKTSRSGSIHPFELARRAIEAENTEAEDRFREYAGAMPKVPQGRITARLVNALAERLGQDPAVLGPWLRHGEDDEAEPEEPGAEPAQEPEPVCQVYGDTWDGLLREGRLSHLLQRIEAGASAGQLIAEGWPVEEPPPRESAGAAQPPDPGEDISRAAHRLAPAWAPSGTTARARWVRAYQEAHGCAVGRA